ncbi:MAG: hypothetical protein GY913_25285 [Proteobacteria bacterium]|nr:hypothetical protein [Pseudomonadota bacterium]MCP4920228.1 hypothetical protein [Pseudomonadota bacterium]
MIWLLACTVATSNSQDATAFSTGDCPLVTDDELRAECLLSIGAPCESIEAGRWRAECFFVRAEEQLGANPEAAVESCAQAGPFAGECWTHLFKALADPADGRTLDDSLAVEARFAAPDWRPPWGWWWRRHHEAAEVLDLAVCAEVERDDLRRRCENAAPTALSLGWRRRIAERPRTWCSRTLDDLSRDPVGRTWVRTDALDALVLTELEQCPG